MGRDDLCVDIWYFINWCDLVYGVSDGSVVKCGYELSNVLWGVFINFIDCDG